MYRSPRMINQSENLQLLQNIYFPEIFRFVIGCSTLFIKALRTVQTGWGHGHFPMNPSRMCTRKSVEQLAVLLTIVSLQHTTTDAYEYFLPDPFSHLIIHKHAYVPCLLRSDHAHSSCFLFADGSRSTKSLPLVALNSLLRYSPNWLIPSLHSC